MYIEELVPADINQLKAEYNRPPQSLQTVLTPQDNAGDMVAGVEQAAWHSQELPVALGLQEVAIPPPPPQVGRWIMPKGWGLYSEVTDRARQMLSVNDGPTQEHKPDSGSSIHPSRLKSFVNKKISTLQGVAAMQGHGTEGKGTGQPAHDSAL